MYDILGWILLAMFVLAIIAITSEFWMLILGAVIDTVLEIIGAIAWVVGGLLEFIFSGFGRTNKRIEKPGPCFGSSVTETEDNSLRRRSMILHQEKNSSDVYTDDYNGMFLYALFSGCLITLVGIGINPTGPGVVFGLGVALMILSSIAIRVQENREFTNPNHDLAVYQSMKIKSGLINLGLGIMCCIVAIAITCVVAIDICTIPGLALVGFGAGKVMKHSFIARSSPELLSWVIRVKYFYRNTIGLIAKATEYKTNQTSQRVAV